MDNIQENNCDTIHHVNYDNKEIIIIATAHVSKKSQEDVKRVIESEKPDSVCIELDKSRFKTITEKSDFSSMDIVKVIKEKKAIVVLVNLLLASFQRKIAKNMDVEPGCEMIQAINSAKEINANIILADRDIQVTFKRIWRKSNFIQKFKLLSQILGTFLLSADNIKEDEIEKMKTSDSLDGAINMMWKSFPLIKEVLLDERDRFLANKIRCAQGQKIVAVLGAAHVPGVKRYLNKEISFVPQTIEARNFSRHISDKSVTNQEKSLLNTIYTQENRKQTKNSKLYTLKNNVELESENRILDILFNKIPKPGISGTIVAIIIPAILLIWIIYGFFNNSGVENLLSYILGTGCGAALGSLVASAHPITVLVGFIAAPITVMHPLLGVGWFTGLSEALLKKPKVSDLQNLSEDIKTLKGFYKNRFSRILLVIIVSSLGTNLGIFLGIPLFNKIVVPFLLSLF